jgi:hypothetical protein
MTYSSIAASRADLALTGRITSAVAQEVAASIDPNATTTRVHWSVLTAQDVEAAYAFALAGDNPDPGGDPGVITDGMILSAVQAALAEVAPVPWPAIAAPP